MERQNLHEEQIGDLIQELDSDYEMSEEELEPCDIVSDDLYTEAQPIEEDVGQYLQSWTSGPHIPIIYEFDDFQSGITTNIFSENSSESIFFEHFLNFSIMSKIVEETNKFYYFNFNKKEHGPKSRSHKWKDTTVQEMYVFFATAMLMTRNKHLSIEEHWSTDPLLASPIFGKTMPRDQYQLLLQMLHFSDPYELASQDKLVKLRLLLEHTRKIFKETMVPHENLCIDESIIVFKGRLKFKQYLPKKRHRFGIKMFVLCDVMTGYIVDFIIYCGQGTEIVDDQNIGVSGAVVTTLLNDYIGKGHNLWCDNWYTSPTLFKYLHTNRTNACGTVRKNRKGMPDFKKLKKGEIEAKKNSPLLALKWCDRRDVHILTTLHDESFECTGKNHYQTGEPILKPKCIIEYNKSMGAVDKTDMMLSSLSFDVRPTIGGGPLAGPPATATSSGEADPDFVGPIQNVTVAVGREAVLSCSVTDLGSNRVGWMKAEDQTILTLHTRVVTHNSRISVSQDGPGTWQLRIRQLRESDRGCYMCQINTSTMKKQLGCIDVHVPPDISDGQTSGDVTAQEGDNSTLVCRATGRPLPRILWRREDGDHLLLRKGPREVVKAETFAGDSLTLVKLERRQMGAYLCIASNDVPPAVSKRITLNVNFAPVIKVPNQLLGAPLGTDVQLECFVEAFPNTINYWVKNRGDVLLTGKKHIITEVKTGPYKVHLQLIISSFSKRDVGTYTCVSTNSLGRADGMIRLYEIKVPTKPPTTSTTTEASTTTISSAMTPTQVAVIRRKVLIARTTNDPRRMTSTSLSIEENLLKPSDRSAPKEYFYNYASSAGNATTRPTVTYGVSAMLFLLSVLRTR